MSKKLTLIALILSLAAILALPLNAKPPPGKGGGKGGEEPPPDPAIVYVAVNSSGGGEQLMVMNADGSNQTVLLSSEIDEFFYPAWSPAGGSAVFEINDGTLFSLWLIDIVVTDAGVQGERLELLVDDAFVAAWSPGGDLIAYVGNHDNPQGIFLIDHVIGVSTLIVPDPITTFNGEPDQFMDVGWPTWSPDGTHIAYIGKSPGSDPDAFADAIIIKEVVADTGEIIDGPETVVATGIQPMVAKTGPSGRELDWSRGGDFLAFRARREGEWGLHIVEIATGVVLLLPESTSAFSPTWSPDDKELVFKNLTGKKHRIVIRDLVTQLEALLAAGKGLFEPDWRR